MFFRELVYVVYFHLLTTGLLAKQILIKSPSGKSSLRVYKGVDDIDDKYPYVVALELYVPQLNARDYIRGCTGSLITDEWVLSAAHCMSENPMGPHRIRYGNTVKNNKPPRYSNVRKAIPHHAFDLATESNDIGLIKVFKVSLASYGCVSSVDYRTLTGLPVTLVGYGVTSLPPPGIDHVNYTIHNDPKYRKIGQAVVIPCSRRQKTKAFICIVGKCSPEENTQFTALYGDSGGPLLQGGKIVGVTSQLEDVDKVNYTLYAPVSPFLDWMFYKMSSSNN